MVPYRRMGKMEENLENTTSTNFLHQLTHLWKSPRGTVLRIEALALVAIVVTFFLTVLGSCRRWSNHWVVQKGFLAANVLSLSLGTYSIGSMQSSSVKSKMYPYWSVSLLTLFGCTDSVTSYNGLDYKSPLLKMLFQLALYSGYVLFMSIPTIPTDVGNIAIVILSAITFIKGFHSSLALVLQSRMRDMLAKTAGFVQQHFLSLGRDYGEEARYIMIDFPPDLEALIFGRPKDTEPSRVDLADIDLICQEKVELQSFYDLCVAFGLSHQLQRHILGLARNKYYRIDDMDTDYEWALKVIDVELALLYEIFFTGNAYLHFYEAKAACFWALASFIAICFVVVTVAIPTMTSRPNISLGFGTTVVNTTTADLFITLVILIALALLQLTHLIWCWTSNWARLAFVCECVRNKKKGIRMQWSWWIRLKWFVISRTNWFDRYLWQDKLGQCSLVAAQERRECKFLSRTTTSMFGPRMHGLQYMGHMLWDMWGRDTNKGSAFRLDNIVKASITDFFGKIRNNKIDGSWLSELYEIGVNIDQFPYISFHDRWSFVNYMFGPHGTSFTCASHGRHYGHSVMVWHLATHYCELAEQEKECAGGRGTAAEAGGESEKNRHVANALSKYCTYLLVSAPELLPGPAVEAKGMIADVFEEATLAPLEAMAGNRSFMVGVNLGRQLLGEIALPDGRRCSDPWKVLALVWVQILVYAAPYGNSEEHMRHLAQGGKLITHLWALLYHLGIREWQLLDINVEHEPGHRDANDAHDVDIQQDEISLASLRPPGEHNSSDQSTAVASHIMLTDHIPHQYCLV